MVNNASIGTPWSAVAAIRRFYALQYLSASKRKASLPGRPTATGGLVTVIVCVRALLSRAPPYFLAGKTSRTLPSFCVGWSLAPSVTTHSPDVSHDMRDPFAWSARVRANSALNFSRCASF